MGWRCGARGRALAQKIQGPQFKPQDPKKKKKGIKWKIPKINNS
jgi:hypothetical protein